MSIKTDLKELLDQFNGLNVNKKSQKKPNNQSASKTTKLKRTAAERFSKIKQRISDNKQYTNLSKSIKKSKSKAKSKAINKIVDTKLINNMIYDIVGNINWNSVKKNTQDYILTKKNYNEQKETNKINITFLSIFISVKPGETFGSSLVSKETEGEDIFLRFENKKRFQTGCLFTTVLLRYSKKLNDLKKVYKFLLKCIYDHNYDLCKRFC